MKLRLIILQFLISILFSQSSLAQSAACNRSCLDNALNVYLAALIDNEPSQAPLASTYRHTENDLVIPLGEGMWRSVTALGDVQRHYLDEVTGNAVYYGILEEGEVRAIVSLRLHVENQEINEAELFIGRETDPGSDGVPGSTLWDADHLTTGNPPLVRTVPVEERSSRAELIYISNSYWDGIVNRNPNIAAAHPGCFRDENGQATIGRPLPDDRINDGGLNGLSDCRSGTSTFNVLNVVSRRWAVVDIEQQVVVASALFIREPGNFKRRNHFSDVFYIDSGLLRGIYTAMHYVDPMQPVPNWPPYEGNLPLPINFGETK